MALEQEFILDIPDHEAEKIQSITEAVNYIASNPIVEVRQRGYSFSSEKTH